MFITFCVFLGTLDKKNKTSFPLSLILQVNEEIINMYVISIIIAVSNYEYYGRA